MKKGRASCHAMDLRSPRSDLAPLGAFVACTALWGTTFLAIKIGGTTLPPLWGATLRLAIAGVILAALSIALRQTFPRGRMLLFAAIYGVLEFGVNLGLLYWAERTVPSGLAAVFYATSPLTAAVLAHFFGDERLDAWRLSATLVAFLGVVVAFASQLGVTADPLALLAVLAAATAAGAAGLALRRVPAMPVLPTNAVGCVIGAIILFPVVLLVGEPLAVPATWDAWGPVLYLVLAGSVGAFTLFTFLVNRWGVGRATLVGVTVPIVAVAVGAILGHERLPWTTLAGGALVLAGVTGAVLRARYVERARRAPAAS